MKSHVKNWYLKKYPTDDLGNYINPKLTFYKLLREMLACKDAYDVIGVRESVVRERVFEELQLKLRVPYEFYLHSLALTSQT